VSVRVRAEKTSPFPHLLIFLTPLRNTQTREGRGFQSHCRGRTAPHFCSGPSTPAIARSAGAGLGPAASVRSNSGFYTWTPPALFSTIRHKGRESPRVSQGGYLPKLRPADPGNSASYASAFVLPHRKNPLHLYIHPTLPCSLLHQLRALHNFPVTGQRELTFCHV
jgi:hypothetical protein